MMAFFYKGGEASEKTWAGLDKNLGRFTPKPGQVFIETWAGFLKYPAAFLEACNQNQANY